MSAFLGSRAQASGCVPRLSTLELRTEPLFPHVDRDVDADGGNDISEIRLNDSYRFILMQFVSLIAYYSRFTA